MVGLTGRVVSANSGKVQVELSNSGQFVELASTERFFIGDPVLVSSENGKLIGVTRAARKTIQLLSEEERLGPYWHK